MAPALTGIRWVVLAWGLPCSFSQQTSGTAVAWGFHWAGRHLLTHVAGHWCWMSAPSSREAPNQSPCTWPLHMAWTSHSWVPRWSIPIASIQKTHLWPSYTLSYLPSLTGQIMGPALIHGRRLPKGNEYKEVWFMGLPMKWDIVVSLENGMWADFHFPVSNVEAN